MVLNFFIVSFLFAHEQAEEKCSFCFTSARPYAMKKWKENSAIDVSFELADPRLQKMKLEYKR